MTIACPDSRRRAQVKSGIFPYLYPFPFNNIQDNTSGRFGNVLRA
jgi:hypothetical protein